MSTFENYIFIHRSCEFSQRSIYFLHNFVPNHYYTKPIKLETIYIIIQVHKINKLF